METKDELLSEGEKYFKKVMQDFNQNRKGETYAKNSATDAPMLLQSTFLKKVIS